MYCPLISLKRTTLLRPLLPSMMELSKTNPKLDYATMKKFKKDNQMIRGHLLNHMTNPLFDLFVTFKYANII